MSGYRLAGLAFLGLLAACGGGDGGAGGVTAEESEQLNEAAAMLDEAPDTLVASDETGLGNGQPATQEAQASDDVAANAQ